MHITRNAQSALQIKIVIVTTKGSSAISKCISLTQFLPPEQARFKRCDIYFCQNRVQFLRQSAPQKDLFSTSPFPVTRVEVTRRIKPTRIQGCQMVNVQTKNPQPPPDCFGNDTGLVFLPSTDFKHWNAINSVGYLSGCRCNLTRHYCLVQADDIKQKATSLRLVLSCGSIELT
jgi:hypothetical protein